MAVPAVDPSNGLDADKRLPIALITATKEDKVRSLARRNPIKAFLMVVYVWGGVAFALPLLSGIGLGVLPIDLPGVAPFVVLAAIGLAVAGFVVSRWLDEREGRAFRRRLFHLRVHPLWYLLALIGLPLTALATVTVGQGTGPVRELSERPELLALAIASAGAAFLLVNWWEEAGWTGFFLERLQGQIGPVWASVVTTFAQAVIHLPLFFIVDGVTSGRVAGDQIPLYLGLLFVLPIPVRMIITWIYNSTGRSVPVVGIFHAGLGVATGADLVPAIAPDFEMLWVYAGFTVVGALVLVLTRGRLGYRPEQAEKFGRLRVGAAATPGEA